MMVTLKRLLSCLLLLFTITCSWAQQSRPIMVFDRVSHDFGDVKRKGGNLIKEFRFVNKGDAPLIIKKITKSCSCMSVTYSRKPVLPGEASVIKIKYEPHKVEAGVFNKVVQIYSNDATGKVRLITIHGNSVDDMKHH